MMTISGTSNLAQWLTRLTPSDLPEAVKRTAARCLLDTLGVMLAGSATRTAELSRRVITMSAAAGNAMVAGSDLRVCAPAAAFANGVAAHALDFDDNSYAGFVHGSAVIVPAVLAVAQTSHADGEALLTALAAGAECQYRVGMALGRTLYDRGWWTTGVLGVIGACAAAAKLLNLDVDTTAHALGLAIAGTGGSKSAFGTDAKPLLAGRAAEAGVMAALLAEQGANGPVDALEHIYGLAALCNDGRLDGRWLDPACDQWCLLTPGVDVKRLPVCLSSHAAVDGVLKLATDHHIDATQIAAIMCDVPPVVIANLIYPRPRTGQQGQFSMPFAIAASLLYGQITLDHLDDGLMADERLVALMARVSMTSGPRWQNPAQLIAAPEGAGVVVRLHDGNSFSCFIAKAVGSADHPLSDDALEHKFMRCAAGVLGTVLAERLRITLRQAAILPNLNELVMAMPASKEPE